MIPPSRERFCLPWKALPVALCLSFGNAPSTLQAYEWNGGGTTENWHDTVNWIGGVDPTVGTGVELHFGGSTGLSPSNDYSSLSQFGFIYFDSAAGAFTLSGNPVQIAGAIQNNSTALQTLSFSTALVLNGAAYTEVNATTGDILITSPLQLDTPELRAYANTGKTISISGQISMIGALDSTIIKTGAGTLVLSNSGNSFGGAAKMIDIQGGVVSVPNDGALGHASTGINLNASGADTGLRATGSFATSRTMNFAQATNGIAVAAGSELTINSSFTGLSGTTQLVKSDFGTLILNAANTSWSGSITSPGSQQVLTGGLLVNAGVARLTNANALGVSTNIVAVNNATGAQVQIAGGINIPNSLVLNTSISSGYAGGINWSGGLRSMGSGVTNTWSGAISENEDSGITADLGNTLNLTGGINLNGHRGIFGGAGNINVTTAGISSVGGIDKIGSGTSNIQAAIAAPSGNGIRVLAGTLRFSGSGALASGSSPGVSVLPGATLAIDNSGTVQANRLGGRAISFTGGNLNFTGGSTVTSEAIGTPTFNRGQTTITVVAGSGGANLTFTGGANNVSPAQTTGGTGATALFRGTSLGTAAGANVGTIAWTTGGLLTTGATGATGTATKSIVPWAIIDNTATGLGSSFVTANTASLATSTGTAILRPLNVSEYSTNTTLALNSNMLISAALSGQNAATVNSLTFSGGSLTMNSLATLNNASGGILVRNGIVTSISGGIVNILPTNPALNIHTPGTASLTITSVMTGGQAADKIGLVKAGDGTLTLTTPKATLGGTANISLNSLNLQTVVNQGTLKLNGGINTLGANNFLTVGAGGTLDLNGTTQYVQGFGSDGTFNGIADTVTAGGTVTSSTNAALVTNSDTRNWAGQISGNVFYNRTGAGSTTTIFTPQGYTRGTLINGGNVALRDYGKLSGTTEIELSYAGLALDNTQAAGISGRLGSAPITMRGGLLTYAGRAQTASAETIGSISLADGWNSISITSGGTSISSTDLTAASLQRTGGSTAVVNGQVDSGSHWMLTSAPTLTNNIIAPWALARLEWATYAPGLGWGALNDAGRPGYSSSDLETSGPTDNVRVTSSPATLTADATAGTVNVNASANTTVDLGSRQLSVAGGGLILGATADNTTINLTNGTLTSGSFNNGGDFYVHFLPYGGSNRSALIDANITNNGSGAVRLILSSSETSGTLQAVTINGTNTYTGGTVLNGGHTIVGNTGTIPAGGITLNGATLSQSIAGQSTPGVINSANIITLNGPSTLNLVNNNTLAGLVFNNNGSGITSAQGGPVVNTSVNGVGNDGRGILTIGASGITASSSNVAGPATIVGRVDMGSSPNTINVSPITVASASVAPLQATLAISGFTGSSGGITKSGTGVLQLNAQSTFTGALNVTAGGINFGTLATSGLAGTSAGGSRYSALTLGAGTWLNLANSDAVIGSLAGSGRVINVSPVGAPAVSRILSIGFDNSNTIYSGGFTRWSDQLANPVQVNKIGTGTLSLTGSSTLTTVLTVSQGGLTFSGAGSALFASYTILPSGTLRLDNSGTNAQHRLGGTLASGALNISGGEFRITGNTAVTTLESIGTVSMGTTTGNLSGTPVITLEAKPGFQISLATNAFGAIPIGSSSLIRGVSPASAAGLATFNIGNASLGAPAGSGTGANGTTTMAIRPDILGDVSPTGVGTGFIVKDSVNNTLRPLTSTEMATSIASGFAGTTVNYGLATPFYNSGRTILGSLTLASSGGVLQDPGLSSTQPDGLPISTVINTGGILAFSGNAGITTGRLETNSTNFLHVHAVGNLTISSVITGNGGLTKGDAGTLTLTARNIYTTQTTINAGTVILNGGDNTLPSVTTILGGPTAVLDLNGTNQIVATFGNNGSARSAGSGGTLTNSSLTPSVFTTSMGSTQVFSGSITGNLSFNKSGNNAFTLTNANSFTGVTSLRSNTTTLMDAGTLSGTSAV